MAVVVDAGTEVAGVELVVELPQADIANASAPRRNTAIARMVVTVTQSESLPGVDGKGLPFRPVGLFVPLVMLAGDVPSRRFGGILEPVRSRLVDSPSCRGRLHSSGT